MKMSVEAQRFQQIKERRLQFLGRAPRWFYWTNHLEYWHPIADIFLRMTTV